MTAVLILDTGPLVALLNPKDPKHEWAKEALRVRASVVTCEAVASEAFFLLRRSERASASLRAMLTEGSLELRSLSDEAAALSKLMERYASVPMSFANASLVRLSELLPRAVVATLDSDFRVYRRFGRQVLPLLAP